MPLTPAYTSKSPDRHGLYPYSSDENAVWSLLFNRQIKALQAHACAAYLNGLNVLGLSADTVPQVRDIDEKLFKISGAGVKGVSALIPQVEFSTLLKNRKFPVATFIRTREDLDYLQEPDIFHEVFGHCPMMTDPKFCRFMQAFGDLALSLEEELLPQLFRLFWFTVEFGLIRENDEIKAFGAGIMSSPAELRHAVSGPAERVPFDLLHVLRTPYRIDIVQPVYFVITGLDQLVSAIEGDMEGAIKTAMIQGDLPAKFDVAA